MHFFMIVIRFFFVFLFVDCRYYFTRQFSQTFIVIAGLLNRGFLAMAARRQLHNIFSSACALLNKTERFDVFQDAPEHNLLAKNRL